MNAANVLLGLLCLALSPPVEEVGGVPADGSRVVFLGDSITQAGHYVVYVEAYLLTRFPDRTISIVNRGLSSETASGTSEPDHDPRRPCIHDRFERDVPPLAPDRVVICYGMNDGNYHQFDGERFALYQDGIRRLIDRCRDEAGADRVDLLTPPPFDPYRRQVGDPEATHFGYKYPAIDYDEVLATYSSWLCSLREEGYLVADVHKSFNEHLSKRRQERVSLSFSPDGVHPNATGHWLIAQGLLHAWKAPALVAEARIDASASKVLAGDVQALSTEDGAISMVWRSPLPMPIDPSWDAESLRLDDVADRLNRYRLKVSGLKPSSNWRLLAGIKGEEPVEVGTFSAGELAAGIDLTALPDFPTVATAREVLQRLSALRSAEGAAWRASIRGDAEAPRQTDDEMDRIRALCQPKEVLVRLEAAADPTR